MPRGLLIVLIIVSTAILAVALHLAPRCPGSSVPRISIGNWVQATACEERAQ